MKTFYRIKKGKKEEIRKIKYNRDIADTVGVTEGYISQIMNGKDNITKLIAYAICKAVSPKLEIEDIFDIIQK